jgi:uracil-DNA glycosylase
MVSIRMKWPDAQKEIAACEECVHQWKGQVTQPLTIGEIPNPPPLVKILFVGVAPTDLEGRNKGGHFYSSAGDNLRRGLFRLLNDRFAIPLKGLSLGEGDRHFHGEGYFFVHAGKTRPVGQDVPPKELLIYCANRHLRTEINILNPSAICFLGIKNLKSVTQSLFDRQVVEAPVRASLDRWTGWVALAPQPVRGGERRTEIVLAKLLKLVN